MTTTALRALCIKNDWFNHGSNHQYGKLFDRAAEGASPEELATIIAILLFVKIGMTYMEYRKHG